MSSVYYGLNTILIYHKFITNLSHFVDYLLTSLAIQ